LSGYLGVGDADESDYGHHDERNDAKKTDAMTLNFIVHCFFSYAVLVENSDSSGQINLTKFSLILFHAFFDSKISI